MTGSLNGAGRGLNFVVVDPDMKEAVRIARFDTFSSGSASVSAILLTPNSTALSWSQTGPRLVADLQRAGIWPIT